MMDKNSSDLLRRLQQPPPKKHSSHSRNAILVLVGVVALILLVLLLVHQRDISFDPTKTKSSSGPKQKIVFTGELKQNDLALSAADEKRLEQTLGDVGDRFKHVLVWVEKDDKYAKLGPDTELRYQITLVTHDGARIKSVIHRAKQSRVVEAIAKRIERDVEAYLKIEPGKNPPGSFTNTN